MCGSSDPFFNIQGGAGVMRKPSPPHPLFVQIDPGVGSAEKGVWLNTDWAEQTG